jgi:hypothetical protein
MLNLDKVYILKIIIKTKLTGKVQKENLGFPFKERFKRKT